MSNLTIEINETPHVLNLGSQSFAFKATVGAKALARLVAPLASLRQEDAEKDPIGSVETTQAALAELLEDPDRDRDRWLAMDLPVDVFLKVTEWIIEQYTGRPTQPSSGSSDN
jgi:hypothetical protein